MMSWEAWGITEYLDYQECRECYGVGESIGEENAMQSCSRCKGTGIEPFQHFEDDVI